jgi:hypothetical protein
MLQSKPRAMMSAARTVSEYLTAPSKIAQTLDWKKHSASVLNVMISKEKIDLAVALHPACQQEEFDDGSSTLASSHSLSIRILQPIHLPSRIANHNRLLVDEKVPHSFISAINDYNVCGILVGWPVEREGWCGAPCGRVLNTLDQLVQSPSVASTRLFANNRPIALYDMDHHTFDEDAWGRSSCYTELCHDQVHICSEEQSYNDFISSHNTAAPLITLWSDFCKMYWPHLVQSDGTSDDRNNTYHCPSTNPSMNHAPIQHTTDDSYSSLFG